MFSWNGGKPVNGVGVDCWKTTPRLVKSAMHIRIISVLVLLLFSEVAPLMPPLAPLEFNSGASEKLILL